MSVRVTMRGPDGRVVYDDLHHSFPAAAHGARGVRADSVQLTAEFRAGEQAPALQDLVRTLGECLAHKSKE